jgi:tRNA threonylcarbamoyladenosine biosynthesis protein TsaE
MADNRDKIQVSCPSLHELPSVVQALRAYAGNIKVWMFEGEMGAGKTTLITAICKSFGVTDTVTSPTFALVNEYGNTQGETFYHFDFYRIKDESEARDIGIDEYFYSGHFCFVEWPTLIPSLYPDQFLGIRITAEPEGRRIIEVTRHE